MRIAFVAGLLLMGCGRTTPALVSSNDIDGDAIPNTLTDTPGNPERGRRVFSDRDAGHCVLCHEVSDLDAEFQGNIGPSLTGVAGRLSSGQLRLRVVDYQLVQPGALMPSYYRNHDLHQVQDAFRGASILSAQDIEDVVAYLGDLKAEDENG